MAMAQACGTTQTDAPGVAEAFLRHFKDLDDPRMPGKCRYPLDEVLLLAVAAVTSDCDGFVDMEDYGRQKLDVLREFLPYKNGVPTHGQIGNILARLDPEQFRLCFAAWRKADGIADDIVEEEEEYAGKLPWTVAVAMDGKAARGSRRRKSGNKVMTMVTAFGVRTRTVLAQVKVDGKSNEITALPKVVEALGDVERYVLTVDAAGCQRAVAEQIIAEKADYVMSLKGNQSSLHDDVALFVEEQKAKDYADCEVTRHRSVTKGHGRIETRITTVIGEVGWLQERHKWPGLKSVVVVQSVRQTMHRPEDEAEPDSGGAPQAGAAVKVEAGTPAAAVAATAVPPGAGPGKRKTAKKAKPQPMKTVEKLPNGMEMVTETETRLYITSLLLPAILLAMLIRGHWAIENSLHWILDMVFREDASRVRMGNAPGNLTTLRHAAFNIHRSHAARERLASAMSMRRQRKMASRSDAFARSLLM